MRVWPGGERSNCGGEEGGEMVGGQEKMVRERAGRGIIKMRKITKITFGKNYVLPTWPMLFRDPTWQWPAQRRFPSALELELFFAYK